MSNLRLLPVVELDPFEYRRGNPPPPSPEVPIEVGPRVWAEFWTASLASADVHGLTPLPDSWVVPIDQVEGESLLREVLGRHFDAPDPAAFLATLPGPFDPKSGMNADGEPIEEHFTALRGGLALRDEVTATTITPECCGDLGNWRSWQNATRVETESWQEVWIGHPSARGLPSRWRTSGAEHHRIGRGDGGAAADRPRSPPRRRGGRAGGAPVLGTTAPRRAEHGPARPTPRRAGRDAPRRPERVRPRLTSSAGKLCWQALLASSAGKLE